MNWISKLLGFKDVVISDVGKALEDSRKESAELFSGNRNTKGKDISEPIFAMLNTWKENPKRFSLVSENLVYSILNYDGVYDYHNSQKTPSYYLMVVDQESKESFNFGLWLGTQCYSDAYNSMHFMYSRFAQHSIYPVLDSKVHTKPSWMTQDEMDLIIDTVEPYYLKRVNRYRDIVESRIDRTRKANERKSEIAKQKERDRLTGVYK